MSKPTDTKSKYEIFLLFHNKNYYANVSQCNVYPYIASFVNFDTRRRWVLVLSPGRLIHDTHLLVRWARLRCFWMFETQIMQSVPRTEPRFLCCLACGILDHVWCKKLRQQRNEICKWIQGAPTDENGVPRPGMCLHVLRLVQTCRHSLETRSAISCLKTAAKNSKCLNIHTKTYTAQMP